MRKITLLFTSAVAVMLGCDARSDPFGVDPSAAQLSQVPEHVVGMASLTFPVRELSSGTSQIMGWCDASAGIVLVSVPGTGTMTHIGQFSIEHTLCLNLATGEITLGEATVTAANGDELYATFHGLPLPALTPPTWDLDLVVTGGAGRFVQAEGAFAIRLVKPTESTWQTIGEGWLRYYASDRSGK